MAELGEVSCEFYRRTRTPEGFRYDHILVNGPDSLSWGTYRTMTPPAAGDLIWLANHDHANKDHGCCYRVIERLWQPAQYMSMAWPVATPRQNVPISLSLIIVPEDGPFRDEAPLTEEEANA